jgi:SAM-dependent methyltransferase
VVAAKKPIGEITRGTTNPNRLRRVDRYIVTLPIVRKPGCVLVDLGFGATPVTAVELLARVRKVNPSARMVGIEIDRERVQNAKPLEATGLEFLLGGFETPLPPGLEQADLIRSFNVLRQYDEAEVADAWKLMCSRLSENGRLIEGTCDEIGRVSSWITLDRSGPQSFTIALRLTGLELPSKVAERLPKALIHRNVAGERIHAFLSDLDRAWLANAGVGALSAVQRWVATCEAMIAGGWPVKVDRKRWRLGELTVDWDAVRPGN